MREQCMTYEAVQMLSLCPVLYVQLAYVNAEKGSNESYRDS